MHKAIKRTALSLALGFGLIGSAAATIQSIEGTHLTFTYDDALVGLFGTPSVSGDTLFFTPNSFRTAGIGASSYSFVSDTFVFTVAAKSGYTLTGVDLTEQGDYRLHRPTGTGDLGVDLTGEIRVRDLGTLAEKTANLQTTAPLTTLGSSTIDWTANADTSFQAWQSTGARVTIENVLDAWTDTTKPSSAFIEKKYVGASFQVTAVPEPETYAMFLAGLGMLGMVARRRLK